MYRKLKAQIRDLRFSLDGALTRNGTMQDSLNKMISTNEDLRRENKRLVSQLHKERQRVARGAE